MACPQLCWHTFNKRQARRDAVTGDPLAAITQRPRLIQKTHFQDTHLISDFRDGACPQHVDADLCIFGAGAAGLAIAREFLGTAQKVYVIESGGMEATERNQSLYEGTSIGNPTLDPATGRIRVFGGSCSLWGGGCVPVEGMDARDWMTHSGWPVSHAELEPYYLRACGFCGIDGADLAEGGFRNQPRIAPLPFDPEVLTNHTCMVSSVQPGATYGRQFAQSSNVHVLLHANLLELEASADGGSVLAARISSLDGQTSRIHARRYVLACGGIENARLLLLSDSVMPNGLGNQHDLVGRYFMDHPSGKLGTIRTDTPETLTRAYNWVPSSSDVPSHPEICLSPQAQRKHRVLAARVRAFAVEETVPSGIQALREFRAALKPQPQDESAELARRLSTRNNGEQSIFRPPPSQGLPRLALRTARGSADIVTAFIRKVSRKSTVASTRVDLIGFFEQAPNPDSRITLSDELDALGQRKVCVDWQLTELDHRTHRTAAALFGEELAKSCDGVFTLEPWLEKDGAGSSPLAGTAHHLGTTRMDDDPRRGVVDRHCRVHGVDNLHIAGSSVFPAAGWAFPTLTIVALAIRLAERLQAELETGAQAELVSESR
ncbi:GMC family oxidoreductase [Lysobacter sp. H23M47]|uniref:GMC oxidoreductase n=1 Tax=Lysobacter sp. H23M47 TaxID=2781024 RepID=UPI001D16F3C0|nr:GMC family oxidoreductase [Lysobacter sp. H23M47]